MVSIYEEVRQIQDVFSEYKAIPASAGMLALFGPGLVQTGKF